MAKKKTQKRKQTKRNNKAKSQNKRLSRKKTAKKIAPKKPIRKVKKVKSKASTLSKKPQKNLTVRDSSSPGPTLHIGDSAPNFVLKNQNGEEITLGSLHGQNVVLYFYPKDLTPGCTQEACDFRDSLNRVKEQGAIVLGVSKDDEALHQKFIAKHDLNFDLLADTSGTVCDSYGVIKEKNMYGKKFMGIERTTFLINKDGKVAKVYPKVKVEGHVQEVLNDLSVIK